MLVRQERPNGDVAASAFVAVDHVQAGPGDRVLVLTEGTGVRQLLGDEAGPIRSIIVGIIDDIECLDSGVRSGATKPHVGVPRGN